MKQLQLADFPIPSSWDVQCQIIADLINSPEYIPEAERLVHKELFEGECRKAWEALTRMSQEGQTIDLTTVSVSLGMEFLTTHILPKISGVSGSGSYIYDHCAVLNAAQARKIAYITAVELLQESSRGTPSREDLLAITDKLSSAFLVEYSNTGENCLITQAINRYFDAIQEGNRRHISSGFQTLDYSTKGGFAPGDLIILAARPGFGKTAIMLQMALNMARYTIPTRVYSLEMSEGDLVQRCLLSTGRVCGDSILNNEWEKMETAAKDIPNNMYLKTDMTDINRIIADITLSRRTNKCGAAFIDYLGLTDPINPKEALNNDLGERVRRLKIAAGRNGIPIVLLCQLNRVSLSEKRSPDLHDLGDSDKIGHHADVALMLERVGEADIKMWVRKNRHGKINFAIKLRAENYYTKFREDGYEM